MANKTRRQHRYHSARSPARPFVPRFVSRPRVEIDAGLAWYCVYTRVQAESRAEDALRRAGLPTYLPTETYQVHRRGKVVETERAPVTRYLFVGLTAAAPEFALLKDVLDPIRIPGLVPPLGRLIRVGDQPLRVGAGAIQAFADNCTGAGLQAVAGGRRGFQAGDTARIVDGALSGLNLSIATVLCSDRIRGLVDLLGGRVVVEATTDQLEAA